MLRHPSPRLRAGTPNALLSCAVTSVMSFCLAACGGGGGHSDPANATPIASASSITTNEDTVANGTFSSSDADGDALTHSIVTQPLHGTVTVNGAAFTYTPAANYHGPDQFSFRASDGKASADATVSITVASVNDAPVIQQVSGPSKGDARSIVPFVIVARDDDGDPLTYSVQQVGGTAAQISVTSTGSFTVTVPEVPAVETLVFRASATDGTLTATGDVSMDATPLSPSGKLHTIRGSRNGPGLHLVITGDGYTATEQAALLANATALAELIVNTAPIRLFASAWNVHVLDQVSAESGVDIPSQSIVRDTAFDGTLDCNGTARLLCVNQGKVLTAVAAEFPAYTQVLVTSNTDIYGGSGGTVAVASRNSFAPLIALHETGHSFAGLVDEYVDTALGTGPIPNFSEANTPNATAVTDLSQVKWRHWFANPGSVPHNANEAGVGLFEGALYRATGYYRPTFDSFMRTLSTTLGEVNSEQWAKSIYQRIGGAVQNVTPLATNLSGPSGTPITLAVTPRFGPLIQTVRWYENGAENVAARNGITYRCCTATTGTQSVRVTISDITGIVKDPAPNPAQYEKTWQIVFN